jgi:predicted signal transduction protein with EAL and GGDEF domain
MLRRGEFLEDMGRALLGDGPWRVLMAVRLDQVRELGDALGQAAAYALEQQVAQRLAAELGPGDAQTLWMAFGFGVLCERDSAEAIEALATRLCAAVAASPVTLEGVAHPVTASVGMALAPAGSDAGAVDRWFASAHAAQSIAPRLGGNRIDGVLSREHGGMAPERVLIIREWVKEAASGDNVQVEFQPAVPLRPGRPGIYCVQALLRDYRAPLAGVPRREYLRLARDAGALPMIDRMGWFAAFEAIEAERAQGRATQLLAPVDLASVDAAQLRWLDAELRRRRAYSDALVIELDADVALGRPDLARSFQALEEAGVRIAIADASGDLQRIARLQRFPAGLLRLPLRAVDAVGPARFLELLAPWRASGRELLLDGVADIGRMRALLDLHVDYVLGDALAASSPRLDYEFGPGSP